MKDFYYQPEDFKFVQALVKNHQPIYLYGPPGTGKTIMGREVAKSLGRGVIEVNAHEGLTADSFLGYHSLEGKNVVFREGSLPEAARKGCLLIINEITAVPPDVLFALHRVLEDRIVYIMEQEEGKREIKPAEGFSVLVTDNTRGAGDADGEFMGTKTMNAAFMDRFNMFKVDYLQPAAETEVIRKKFPKIEQWSAEKLIEMANRVREAKARGDITIGFSHRKLEKLCYSYLLFREVPETNKKKAFSMAVSTVFMSAEDESSVGTIKAIYQRIFNIDLDDAQKEEKWKE